MSVRITDPQNVALYDSVTGLAFGETFSSADEAEDFLQHYASRLDASDLRSLTPLQLAHVRLEWQGSRT
jgi:hypothetical protein